jgi:pre-mRNA 3'-end-processing factor FIP1
LTDFHSRRSTRPPRTSFHSELDDIYGDSTDLDPTSHIQQSSINQEAKGELGVEPGYSRDDTVRAVAEAEVQGDEDMNEDDEDEEEDDEEEEEDEDDGLEILMNAPQRSMDFR